MGIMTCRQRKERIFGIDTQPAAFPPTKSNSSAVLSAGWCGACPPLMTTSRSPKVVAPNKARGLRSLGSLWMTRRAAEEDDAYATTNRS